MKRRITSFNRKSAHFRFLRIVLIWAGGILLGLGCEKQNTPVSPLNPELILTVEEVTLTEVWLNLRISEVELPQQVVITRRLAGPTGVENGIFNQVLATHDTTIIDPTVEPATGYVYRAELWQDGQRVLQSKPAAATTMDTTSHEFTWELFTFGDVSSSVLRDVAIISENDIWAVGEIYLWDSTGNEITYNAVHWDGQEWELKQIYVNYLGQPNLAPLYGVFALPNDEIIFSSGLPYLPEGNSWRLYHLWDMGVLGPDDGSVYRIWGTLPNNFYFVGLRGTIVHYNGSSWQKLETPTSAGGTTLDVYDIFGAQNGMTGEEEIYAVAAKQFVTFDRQILKITPEEVSVVSDSGIPYSLHGLWFKGGGPYYVVGSGMYRKRDLTQPGGWEWLHPGVTQYYLYAIRGNDLNDIFVCGSFGELLHFNGMSWRSYRENFDLTALYNISSRGDLVAAVGYAQPRAAAVIGRRTP